MAYQIKVSIMGIEPEIWRRIKIPGNISFLQLHQIIQNAFGWLDYHLFKFQFDKTVVTIPDDDFPPGELYGKGITELDARTEIINELFDSNDICMYEYDFGDGWEHLILIEKRLKDTKKTAVPVCTAGARQRPPEDVGSISGYLDFIRTIGDKKNPERKEMLEWAEKDTGGRIYDPEYFSINEVNRRLQYALEDDLDSAIKLLTGKGLSGTVAWGWSDTYINVGKKSYSMEFIAKMLLRLGEGSRVTIQVDPARWEY